MLEANLTELQREQMRAGVRARVTRRARAAGSEARRWASPALLAMLCASAFAPLFTVAGTGELLVTGVGTWASVGSGALAGVLLQAIDRLRVNNKEKSPSDEEVLAAVEEGLRAALEAQDENAELLRSDIAEVLREVGAGRTALQAAIEAGDRELQRQLAEGLADIGHHFAEYDFLLAELGTVLRLIRDEVTEQAGRSRLNTDLLYQQATDMRMLLQLVSELGRSRFTADPQRPVYGLGAICPYRGLMPFSERDEDVFFGRREATARLVGDLASRVAAQSSGLFIVTGASGAGKSSLLGAGLFPAISRGELSDDAKYWPRKLIAEPGCPPMQKLAAALATLAELDAPSVLRSLTAAPGEACLLIRQAVETFAAKSGIEQPRAAQCRLIIVVDQFEQVFTPRPGSDLGAAAKERDDFITALHAAATVDHRSSGIPAALVLIAVRGDFIGHCAAHPLLAPALQDSQFVVGPMTAQELRLAITGPADVTGLQIQDGVADTILSELREAGGGYDAGALPLLSQEMVTIWENREGNQLTLRGYERAGGANKAVAISADAAYAGLPSGAKELAPAVFLELASISGTGQLSRRTVTVAELYRAAGGQFGPVDQILHAFTSKRLIVVDGESVQIGHDILLEAWPQLRTWLEPDLTGYALRSQLRQAAENWSRHQRASSYLYRGEQLEVVKQAQARWNSSPSRFPALTTTSEEFLAASKSAQYRRSLVNRSALSILALLLLIATLASFAYYRAQRDAIGQRDRAISQQLAAQSEAIGCSNAVLARQESLAASRIAATAQTRQAMIDAASLPCLRTLSLGSGEISSVVVTPNGRFVAIGQSSFFSNSGSAYLWDTATGRRTRLGHTSGSVGAVAFSPGGKVLAVGSSGVQLWNTATGRHIGSAITVRGSVSSLAFSRDGRMLAIGFETVDGSGGAELRKTGTWRQIGRTITTRTSVGSVALGPDGKLMVIGTLSGTGTKSGAGAEYTGAAQLWSTATDRPIGRPLTSLGSDYISVTSVAFSPDGKILATGSYPDTAKTGVLQLWDVSSRREIGHRMTTPIGVLSVAFSPDGKMIATGSGKDNVTGIASALQLWDTGTGRQIGRTQSTGGAVTSVAFSSNGHVLALGDTSATVRLLNPSAEWPIGHPLTGASDIYATAFNPEDGILATGSGTGVVQLWDADTGRHVATYSFGALGPIDTLAFGHGGKILAVGSGGGTAWLLNLADGKQIGRPIGHAISGNIASLSVALGGKIFAVGLGPSTGSGMIQLWNTATRRPIGKTITTQFVDTVAVSRNGEILAAGTNTDFESFRIHLWYSATGRPIGRALIVNADVNAMAFNRDGNILAAGNSDGTIILIDTATGRRIGNPLTNSNGGIEALTFSPDGQTLAASNTAGQVVLWDVATGR